MPARKGIAMTGPAAEPSGRKLPIGEGGTMADSYRWGMPGRPRHTPVTVVLPNLERSATNSVDIREAGRRGKSRRLSIHILTGSIAAAITVLISFASASASTNPIPSVLYRFSPNGIVQGHWRLLQRPVRVHVNVDQTAGCDGISRTWARQDGVQIQLLWGICGKQQIETQKKNYSIAQVHTPAALLKQRALGVDVDLLQVAPNGRVWRFWLQGNLTLALTTRCEHLAIGQCASISAPAARYLAARLPGKPVVTSITRLFPPVSRLMGAIVMLSLLLVGSNRAGNRAKLETFQLNSGHPRLHSVDAAAKKLRVTSRRRWLAKCLAAVAIVSMASAVVSVVHRAPGQAVVGAIVAVPFGMVSTFWLHRWRDPLLSRERSSILAGTAGLLAVRRVISIGATLFLGVLSLLIPLIVLFGWFLAGLSSAEQDLSSILAGLVIAAVVIGYFIDRAAQRLRAYNAQEAMAHDRRHGHLIYLRNFGDDDQKIPASRFSRRGPWQRSTAWLNPIGNARFEEIFTRALARSGPIIAVGQPGGKLRKLFSAMAPTLGAAKTILPHDKWQDQVYKLAVNAHAVVVSATPRQINPGFAWELDMLARKVAHGRIILVFGTGERSALYRSCAAFMGAVGQYPLFKDLTSGWISDGVLIMIHVPAEGWGTWHGWGAERRTGWTYTAAVGEAMAYAEAAWTTRPATDARAPVG
jgi:hypothetical protein